MGLISPDTIELPELTINRQYTLTFEFPFDLTNWTPRMQIRKGATSLKTLMVEPTLVVSSTSASLSEVDLTITEAESVAGFERTEKQQTFPYEFVLKDPSGFSQPYIRGTIPVATDISEVPA